MQRAVDEVNSDLSRFEQIKRFTILPRDFTLEAGEVTPTLKLKRRVSRAFRERDRGSVLLTDVFLVLSTFLASAVETVEALTIVLAMGLTRGWRSTLIGAGAATLALAAIVGALGPALTVIPIETLRLVVGFLLLVFGLQWLRKAILRASGWRAVRDEAAAFERQRAEAANAPHVERAGLDWYAFTISFKACSSKGSRLPSSCLPSGVRREAFRWPRSAPGQRWCSSSS